MPGFKEVTELPPFPENNGGLKRGTVLEATHPAVSQLGLKVGDKIPIGWDGEYVRCGPFTWSVEQLIGEISQGVWVIADESVDLSTPERQMLFSAMVEQLLLKRNEEIVEAPETSTTAEGV